MTVNYQPTTEETRMLYVLYRFYAADGQLLYVGLTIDPGKRFRSHRLTKPWWTAVSRVELEHHDSFEELRAAEAAAIASEHPVHNQLLREPDGVLADELVGKWFVIWRGDQPALRGQIVSRRSRNTFGAKTYFPSGRPNVVMGAHIDDIIGWSLYDTRGEMEAAL